MALTLQGDLEGEGHCASGQEPKDDLYGRVTSGTATPCL